MKNKLIILCLLLVLVFVSCFCLFRGHTVNSSGEAIEIAQKYVNEKYGQKFEDYIVNVTLNDHIWIVSFSKKNFSSEPMCGGGGPKILIKQSNGKIISCVLQK